MPSGRLASAFAQISPRSYTTVAQFFRLDSLDQEKSRAIAAHLQQATKDLAAVQPLLNGVLSEDDEGLLHFSSPETLAPELLYESSAVKEIIAHRDVSFDHLEDNHYGPSYCNDSAFAMPLTGRNDPVFRVALCWHSDGFVVVTYLHHAIADGLTCRHVIEALAATTCGQLDDNFRHCQLKLGEITSLRGNHNEHSIDLEEHCAYLIDGSGALPSASKAPTAPNPPPARPKTQFLLRVWTPSHGRTVNDRSCSRFCKRAAQAWILTMVSRYRAGLLKKQQPLGTANVSTETSLDEHEQHSAQLLFAVGLSRPEDEWGSRAIYCKTSYPVSRLLRALDEPAEVRELEKHITEAIRLARQPSFATAHEQMFGDYLCHCQGDGQRKGRPADIRLCKPETDPFAFFFNTWGFMGQHGTSNLGKKGQPIRWQFPGFPAPRAPDCIRKVAAALGATSYCLVQPSTAAAAAGRGDGGDDTDEIAITFEEDEAPKFAALVEELSKKNEGHAGIPSCWQILDTFRQIV